MNTTTTHPTGATLRRATTADWPEVSALRLSVAENRLSNPASVTQAMYDAYVTTIGRGWVAELDGQIVGFSIANRSGLIWALFVRPGFDGRGLGRALLDTCLAWLTALGAPRAVLDTDAGTRAERFYRRAGWHEVTRHGREITFRLHLHGAVGIPNIDVS